MFTGRIYNLKKICSFHSFYIKEFTGTNKLIINLVSTFDYITYATLFYFE